MLLLAGCATTPTAGPDDLHRALAEYDSSRFEAAAEQAGTVRRSAQGELRAQAAYVEGVSAYRLGDLDRASSRLAVAAGSGEASVEGPARAALGLVLLDRDRPAEAARQLAAAAELLSGPDAREAARRAATAWQLAGDAAAAETWRDRARAVPAGGDGRRGFTLQVGAFRKRPHAERAAREAAELAERFGFGPVRIVHRADRRGRPLHVVQFGRFGSRGAATDARRRVGRLQFIVAALPPS